MFYKVELLDELSNDDEIKTLIVAAKENDISVSLLEKKILGRLRNPISSFERELAKTHMEYIHTVTPVSEAELFDNRNEMLYANIPFLDLNNLTVDNVSMRGRIRFNRPVTMDDYIVPGGYAFIMNGIRVEFDFVNGHYGVNDEGYYFCADTLDTFSFSYLKYLTPEMLNNTTRIDEFFVYSDDETLVPVSIEELSITYTSPTYEEIHIPSKILKSADLTSNAMEQERD